MSRAVRAAALGAALLGVALAVASPAVGQPATPLTREQALGKLRGPDREERRHAVAALAAVGVMADVPVLVEALRDGDPVVRALAHQAIWLVWGRSGDDAVDALFRTGVEQMSQGDLEAATRTFTRIIERKPDFAEGWNKRATVHFLAGEYDESLRDCDEVMKRNPLHFGALAGYGQIYLQLGQPEKALPYFERALAINPTLGQVEAVIEQLKELLRERRRDTTRAPRLPNLGGLS